MVDVIEVHPPRDAPWTERVYTFGGAAPVATIRPGQIVSTWAPDCYNGAVRSANDLPSAVLGNPDYVNPLTGPFHIEGAEVGDTIAVHFLSITPARDWGVSTTIPLFGALTGTSRTAMLNDPLPERTWIYRFDFARGTARFQALDSDAAVDLPLDPMHGTVGVAPPLGEVRASMTPGSWGGNMDSPEVRAGATCYFGVNVPGAQLAFGDGHARQGEGETCGVAVETEMDTVFTVELIKGVATPWPRIENDDFIMSTGSARPLEDAFRIAQADLVGWVSEAMNLSLMDAYQLVTQVGLSPIANVCDPNYTVVGKVAKQYLAGRQVYGGVHAELRARAAAYLSQVGDQV